MRWAVAAVAALGLAAPPAAGAATEDRPDLVVKLPAKPYAGQFAPVFVDAYEQPGRLLYRFDAVIANQGGTLDLFRDGDGPVQQAVWAGGVPPATERPRPDEPAGPSAERFDRSAAGGRLDYAYEKTHEHFHLASAARYELQPAGGAPRASDKVGFCLFDSFGPGSHFRYAVQGPGGETWCAFNRPDQGVVRMGISPGGADRYSAQREFQWVDVTGLAPGPATLRGQANPLLCVLERDEANNATEQARVIPGVRAFGAEAATTAGAPATPVLRGEVVAPEVPARRSGACTPTEGSPGCYVYAEAGGPLGFRVVDPPDHGSVAVAAAEGLEARATYTPAPGYTGEDAFTYVATDARGLTSARATVRLRVGEAAAAPATVVTAAPTTVAATARARLTRVRVVRRRGRWRVLLRSSAPARLSGRLERRGRVVRRLRERRVRRGPARMALGRLRPGRYRLRLLVDGRAARSLTFAVGQKL